MAERQPVMSHTRTDLGSHGGFVNRQQRKIGMSGGCCHQIHFAEIHEAPESVQEIPSVAIHECVVDTPKECSVHARQRIKRTIRLRAGFLFLCQLD